MNTDHFIHTSSKYTYTYIFLFCSLENKIEEISLTDNDKKKKVPLKKSISFNEEAIIIEEGRVLINAF